MIIRAVINQIICFNVRIANGEDLDQTASSDLGLSCLSRPFWSATIGFEIIERLPLPLIKPFFFTNFTITLINRMMEYE